MEVVGVGELSDSGWEFGSECGSVAVSGVLVVSDVGESASSVVTVLCEGVPSDAEWDFVEPQSFSFSKKRHNKEAQNRMRESPSSQTATMFTL